MHNYGIFGQLKNKLAITHCHLIEGERHLILKKKKIKKIEDWDYFFQNWESHMTGANPRTPKKSPRADPDQTASEKAV